MGLTKKQKDYYKMIEEIHHMLKWFVIRYAEGSSKAPYSLVSDILKKGGKKLKK